MEHYHPTIKQVLIEGFLNTAFFFAMYASLKKDISNDCPFSGTHNLEDWLCKNYL
jgi:hypothetical protein